jgi:outer membrane protein assembly factor BamA
MIESQRRLRSLGLFRRVRINEIPHGEADRRDIIVSVEEAPATTIGFGGGLEAGKRLRQATEGDAVERIEFATRGFFEIGRRNLWGRNRSVNLYTRISIRPNDDTETPGGDGRGFGFSEYRVLGTYREPRAFGWNADLSITGVMEQGIRSSFNFSRRGVYSTLARQLTPTISVTGRYSLETTKQFDVRLNPEDQLLIDRLFPQVRLSTVSAAAARDTRDDALDPTRGHLVGLEADLSARALGAQVGFAKTFAQAFYFRQVPRTRRTILAFGARLGLAAGFPYDVTRIGDDGQPVLDPDGNPIVDRVDEIPASERFFAGGDTTVRGYALDRLGADATIDSSGFPKGGQGLIVLNAELRQPVFRDLGAVAFLDAGNVFARVRQFDVGDIRGSVGVGVRYRSPIGPIRVDLGFKLDPRTFANGERESRTALHISIGQAF